MKILVNLIGEQTAPNFIACKQYSANKIINVSTGYTINKSGFLKATYTGAEYENDIVIDDPFDLYEVQSKIRDIIKTYKDSTELILNFTGATKPISIAAFAEFTRNNLKCVYIDSQKDRIIEYCNDVKTEREITCDITIEEHFKMYGNEIMPLEEKSNLKDEKERHRLKDFLKNNFFLAKELIEKFADNYNKDEDFFKKDNSTEDKKGNTVSWSKTNKTININIGGNTFSLIGNSSHKYFTGLWFEDIVRDKFLHYKLNGHLMFNAEIPDKNSGNREAELDVLATNKHKLYIFECKSGVLNRDYVYKLASLKIYLSNLYANIYFITFEPVLSDKFKNVFKAFKIKPISYVELDDFICNNLDCNKII